MLNILGHAQLEERDIGSRCGGFGECGGDRVLIPLEIQKAHFNPHTPPELEHLTPDELKQGMRLGCQCYPNTSGIEISIELP